MELTNAPAKVLNEHVKSLSVKEGKTNGTVSTIPLKNDAPKVFEETNPYLEENTNKSALQMSH